MGRGGHVTAAEDDQAPRYCIETGCGRKLSARMKDAGLDYCETHWNRIIKKEMPENRGEYDLGIDERFT